MKTIGVFPASGALGTSTYTHLLNLVPHNNVVLISRHPDKIPRASKDSGVRTRQASYESTPEELRSAFSDIDVLFLISYPSHVHEYRVKVHLPAINAARAAGVSHLIYSSLAFAGAADSTSSRAVVMQAHLDTEAHLCSLVSTPSSTPFAYTSIREGLYAESVPIYTAFFNPAAPDPVSEIRIPHDGSGPGVAWVKRDELGEASARVIRAVAAGETGFTNRVVLLTGPRVWSLQETVGVVGRLIGKEVKIREVSVNEYVSQPKVVGRFGEVEKARSWATAWEAIRAGETAVLTGELKEILGREPEAFDVVVDKMWGKGS